ncbi:MAG TPA: universal stress protein [Deltaproteobacteria bacterium]|jgi:nucleotide-binding universal stress UspA family protein|nr:universal stress protein [Deltaproteobacteria bacterium]HOI07445.1 universal stress protein [Deltaproteobacteria bacterium]
MRIMMYCDGTKGTLDALPVVMEHARSFQAQVDLVSSLPKGNEAQLEEIEQREEELESIRSLLENQQIPCETHLLIRGRDAGEDIVDYARKHKVSEIIMAAGKSLFEKLSRSWTANRVTSSARCPVVLV